MKFIFTCGGTAGHINPALAVANKLRELLPSCEVLFIGAKNMMEMDLVPLEGYEIHGLTITNLSRDISFEGIKHNINTFKNVVSSTKEAEKIIKKFKPDCVIGTGGYVCFPVICAAHSLNIPTCIHESNAVPGLTTKLLENKVDIIFSSLETDQYSDMSKVKVVGTPVRSSFDSFDMESENIFNNKPVVLSFMGSLGSAFMNEIVSSILKDHKDSLPFNIIHVTGKKYYSDFEPKHGNGFVVFDYLNDIPKYMKSADLILSRSGASTLSEISYLGKPAILVPSPNVTNNHQEKNARYFEKHNAAKVFLENQFTSESLFNEIIDLIMDKSILKNMSDSSKKLSNTESANIICDEIIKLINFRKK